MRLPGFSAGIAIGSTRETKIVPAQFPPGFPWTEEIPGEEHLCHDDCLRKCRTVAENSCSKAYAEDQSGMFNLAECIRDDYQVCVANRRCCPASSIH
jgi:hypothetical protein